eukprot:SAG31_NODE_484_length_15037_cov_9.974762_3_plen_106_part_00
MALRAKGPEYRKLDEDLKNGFSEMCRVRLEEDVLAPEELCARGVVGHRFQSPSGILSNGIRRDVWWRMFLETEVAGTGVVANLISQGGARGRLCYASCNDRQTCA